MLQSDDAPELLRAFGRRDYLLSEAGQFEDSQARVEDEERSARATDEATAWRRSLSAGDTIPGDDAYDFAAMARDGVWPKPDGAGRVPLSPRYWKPGRLVLAGYDLSNGRRVMSSAPLEERVLGDLPDETDAGTIEQILAQATPEDWAEMSSVERRSLEAWAESHGIMLAQGGTQATASDAAPAAAGAVRGRSNPPPPKLSDLADLGQPAQALWDALAGALKGAVAQTLGLPGDVESLVRMLAGGEQVMPTTEDMEARLPPVIPPQASDLVAPNPRAHSAAMGQNAGELGGLGNAPKAAVKGAVGGAKAIMRAAE